LEDILVKMKREKKRGKKRSKKKIDYFSFNKGTSIIAIGLILFVLNIFYEALFLGGSSIEITHYLKLTSYLFIYLGLIFHLVFVGDKPILKSKIILKNLRILFILLWVFSLFFL